MYVLFLSESKIFPFPTNSFSKNTSFFLTDVAFISVKKLLFCPKRVLSKNGHDKKKKNSVRSYCLKMVKLVSSTANSCSFL